MTTVLATFPIPLPPLPEQRRIAAILDHADALRAKRRQVLAHLDSLTRSIFHEMFASIPADSTVVEPTTLNPHWAVREPATPQRVRGRWDRGTRTRQCCE
ncbi:MAG: restriction endonuclease subunit S [Marmoricola sp.]